MMLEAILFIILGLAVFALWVMFSAEEEATEYRFTKLESRMTTTQQEIGALREAHLAKLKESRMRLEHVESKLDLHHDAIRLQNTINGIFSQLIEQKTFVVVDETRAPRKRRKTVKRRKR